jgi:hypothetical protein
MLGLMHNFSASSVKRASVMDYPPPYVTLAPDGSIDLSQVYATGIGEWDKVAVAYGYQDFLKGADETATLNKILSEAFSHGQRYLTDQDARPLGSSSSQSHLWDSGPNSVDELHRIMRVRATVIKHMGENAIREGAPLATIEDVLVAIYLLHGYQVGAASKSIGGMDYTFALRGDGQMPLHTVSPAEQRRALEAVLETVQPEALLLPEPLLNIIPPRPPGYERGREDFHIHTGPPFNVLAPAQVAAQISLQPLFNAERAARLVEFHARNELNPGLDEILDTVLNASWRAPHGSGYAAGISRVVDNIVLTNLINLSADASATNQVRAVASQQLADLQRSLGNAIAAANNREQRAHLVFAADQIERFQKDPHKADLTPLAVPPDGPPIGSFEERFEGELVGNDQLQERWWAWNHPGQRIGASTRFLTIRVFRTEISRSDHQGVNLVLSRG